MDDKALAVFENYRIRRHYDEENERWYFSVVDIVAALIQQPDYQAARTMSRTRFSMPDYQEGGFYPGRVPIF